MKSKKLIAVTTAITVVAGTILNTIPASSNNKEVEETKSEYVVMARNDIGYDKVEDNYNIVDDSESLENNNMIVAKMTESEAKKLENDKNILFVEEDIPFDACGDIEIDEEDYEDIDMLDLLEDDECVDLRSEQWNLDAIHTIKLEENNLSKVKIALLDSGVVFDDDIDIEDRVCINEKNAVENVLFDDATGHGTAVAGIIGAKDNGQGIVGVNPNAQIVSVKILDDNNQTTLSQVVAGIYYAIDSDCDIINMSFGTTVDSEILHKAIREAYDKGILLIAAAGNKAGKPVEYPAAYDEVMAVGATDALGEKLEDSNDGSEIEIFAPGSQILTTGLISGNIVTEGTSIATAQVSGAASLIWSMDKTKSADYIRRLLTATAQNANETGKSDAGIVDIENAINQYDEFQKVYTENKVEYKTIENRDIEEYMDVKLVNGSWSKSTHENIVEYSANTVNYMELMQLAATKADSAYSRIGCLHGLHNYAKSLKFLYECAKKIKTDPYLKDILDEAELIAGFKKDEDYKYYKALRDALYDLLSKDILKKGSEKGRNAKYYKIMGFALHLLSDVYAHRTIVPLYTITGEIESKMKKSTDENSADAKFGTENFESQGSHKIHSDEKLKEWVKNPKEHEERCMKRKCVFRMVELQVMEFKDIKRYTKKDNKGYYEDNVNFCRERYADAKLRCKKMMELMENQKDFDAISILVPSKKYVKLNALKGYLEEIGADIDVISEKVWKEKSTAEEV